MEMDSSVKIKISTALFGQLEYTCEYGILSQQAFIMRIKKNDMLLNLQLSFKHIHRIELLDNEDDKGAGMVFHVNSYMTNRIQETLDNHSRKFVDHQTPYSQNSIIIIDVLNADPHTIRRIKDVLNFCEKFHRNYVIEQWTKRADKEKEDPVLPVMYTSVIPYNQWKTLLNFYRKDVIFESIEMRSTDTNKPLKYTVGKIVASRQDVFSLQRDGRLVALNRENGHGQMSNTTEVVHSYLGTQNLSTKNGQRASYPVRLLINRSSTTQVFAHHQDQSSNGNDNNADFGPGQMLRSVADIPLPPGYRTPRRIAQKQEIHTIEDEESAANDPSTSKQLNDTIFVYPSSGPHGCSIHYSDLKFLDHSYMLNDTIIDFYLKYVYHELISSDMRKKIFMFNSFFYSRLSQSPPNGKPYLVANHRWKRVESNFQFVKSWTKKVDLFDMDYIVVPINEDIHWYLAIIVNPRCGIKSNDIYGQPHQENDTMEIQQNDNVDKNQRDSLFVVVFDSLADCDRKHSVVRDILAEYLRLEYDDKKAATNLSSDFFDKSSTQLVTPSGTPQQKNFVDCGVFLLKFAEIFMRSPPKTINTRISFRSWYPDFKIKEMRDEIKTIIRRIAPHLKFADFLPPNATPMLRRKGRKRMTPPIDTVVSPLRQRRHSDFSIYQYDKESQFTSLDLSSRSRSFDSILQQLKEMPPLVITFREGRNAQKTDINLKNRDFSHNHE